MIGQGDNEKGILDFKEMFNAWVGATQKTWAHDRNKTLGGSEAFGCLRKAYFKRNNAPKDPDYKESWGATRRGDLIENYFVVPCIVWAAKQYGFEYMLSGDTGQITLFEDDDGYLSVTPDGLIRGVSRKALSAYGISDLGSDCFMFEIKSIDPRVDLSEEKAIHHGQVQIQMGLMRETTAFRPNYAVILYVDASFFDNIEVFVVPFDERKYLVAKKRGKQVFEAKDAMSLMAEGRVDGSCKYCPYTAACAAGTLAVMPEKVKKPEDLPDAAKARLNELAQAKRTLAHQIKKLEVEHGRIAEEIKDALRTLGRSNAKSADDGWSISYTMSSGKKSVDTEAMQADGIDVEAYMKRGNPYEILRVTFKDLDSDA